jgi:hypothetical protein
MKHGKETFLVMMVLSCTRNNTMRLWIFEGGTKKFLGMFNLVSLSYHGKDSA